MFLILLLHLIFQFFFMQVSYLLHHWFREIKCNRLSIDTTNSIFSERSLTVWLSGFRSKFQSSWTHQAGTLIGPQFCCSVCRCGFGLTGFSYWLNRGNGRAGAGARELKMGAFSLFLRDMTFGGSCTTLVKAYGNQNKEPSNEFKSTCLRMEREKH